MDRRTLIAAGTVALAGGLPRPAASSDAPAAPASLSIAGLGLPVIDGGRLRNYVFVALRLELGAGKTMEQIKPKEAFFRDALVRAAHRTPFTVPGDWTRLDERALSAALVSASAAISGRGSIRRVQVLSQTPRRRTGIPTPR
ncbi:MULTISPECIES: hypothetical protein [unclassified Brevundimonas]|uniref:hypothetical protein n=1 Tax=unclassified Brevundimonas TaxID=2622653 RepID=UPI000E97E5DB|nr:MULTISPECIES: hypothetical protein [unclassified Brevundimonas]MCK6103122.1 hypothetical protein [Brevundimonas sp. EYE_349]HBI18404.1 hypothetical protein [Brevundimonas sp.]